MMPRPLTEDELTVNKPIVKLRNCMNCKFNVLREYKNRRWSYRVCTKGHDFPRNQCMFKSYCWLHKMKSEK